MILPFAALRPLLLAPEIAHRGLWRPGAAPENSLAAFGAARAAGLGVELDVQLSADGEVVVFHDAALSRMTGADGRVRERALAALRALRLLGTAERIPTLAEALAAIGPETLVLVECKTRFGEEGPLETAVAAVLGAHHGPAAVIGFNPATHAWFAANRPEVARGLNAYAYTDAAAERLPPARRAALAGFATLAEAQAQFILPGLDILASAPVARLRAGGLPVIAWTARTPSERAFAAPLADNLIAEGEGLAA